MKENDGSWDGNEREVSCRKYNKIWIVVDMEDIFKVWVVRRILKYYIIK
jgi:hypothetical protein